MSFPPPLLSRSTPGFRDGNPTGGEDESEVFCCGQSSLKRGIIRVRKRCLSLGSVDRRGVPYLEGRILDGGNWGEKGKERGGRRGERKEEETRGRDGSNGLRV